MLQEDACNAMHFGNNDIGNKKLTRDLDQKQS